MTRRDFRPVGLFSLTSIRGIRNTQRVYRDAANSLDEHDRAVGAILIGEALLYECDRAWARWRDEETATPAERWRAIREIHDTFPDIWRHLDRARRVLASRGVNTAGYDELRPHARRAASNPGLDGSEAFDVEALDDVKRGLAELKLALPGAEWAAIEARTQGLVRLPLSRKWRQRLTLGGSAAAFVATIAWLFSILPHHEARAASASMETELRVVSEQRKMQIVQLEWNLSGRCLPPQAHDLTKLLVQDGQRLEAATFATIYTMHCGEDPLVIHWAFHGAVTKKP